MAPPLVFLPGALGLLEGGGEALARLGERRAVIPIAYRADEGLDALLGRVVAAAGTGRFDVLGQSYGGWIGQCLAARVPDRVRRLVLSHSFALTPRDAWRLRLARRLLTGLPRALARPLLAARIGRALRPVAAADPALHRRQQAAIAGLLERDDFYALLAAQQRCMIESLSSPPAPASCPLLIVESDNDPLIPPGARRALRRRYPRAVVQRFRAAGHVSAIVEPEAYALAVDEFLDRVAPGHAD